MVKAGEIYYDPQYVYPSGNMEDKLLIVLRETNSPNDPVILLPVTTNKGNQHYKDGCNKSKYIFYLRANEDFFVNNTIVQLHILNGITPPSQSNFDKLIIRKSIQYKGKLRAETIYKLIECLQSMEMDIDSDIFRLIFS